MPPAPFRHVVRTRFNEVDMQGRVFNANWLSYFDEAYAEFIENLGEPLAASELLHSVLVKAVVEWKGSATYRDEIGIAVSVSRIGNSSFDFAYEAMVGSETVCTGTHTYVNIDGSTGRSRPLGEPLRRKLETRTH
ncbi:MAG: acyl-CoA thioesterase [Actinomycetota bacterium]